MQGKCSLQSQTPPSSVTCHIPYGWWMFDAWSCSSCKTCHKPPRPFHPRFSPPWGLYQAGVWIAARKNRIGVVGRSVQSKTSDHRSMALASDRRLHKIARARPTFRVTLGSIFKYIPLNMWKLLSYNYRVQHTILALVQHTDLHTNIHNAYLINIIIQ